MKFNKHVVLAYTDITAAGSRVCLSVDGDVDVSPLEVTELKECFPATVGTGHDAGLHTVQIMNCRQPEVTFVVVNCSIPGNICHLVVSKILSHIVKSGAKQLTVVTALRPDPQYSNMMSDVLESCFKCKSVTDFPKMPEDFQVQDAFLNTLLRLLKVENIPVRFLVARGYKATRGCPTDMDGSLQVICNLQAALTKLTGLKFDKDKTLALNFKGLDDDRQEMASMLYL